MNIKLLLSVPLSLILSMSTFAWPGTVSPAEKETQPVIGDLLNTAPIVYESDLSVMEGIASGGSLRVYDKEDDPVTIHVKKAPKKGDVRFEGLQYVYTPFQNESGRDSIHLIAKDTAGNKSAETIINVTIDKNTKSFSYADMKRNSSHYSAVKLYEKGLLKGTRVGSVNLFSPSDKVKRSEFLIMLLSALGLDSQVKNVVNTGLDNDSQLPLWLKPYTMQGIKRGIIAENVFNHDEYITCAEAVLMVDRAGKIKNVKGYNLGLSDTHQIPSWAVQSYLNLGAYRMLDCYDGAAHPNDSLTKDRAADLMWQLYKYNQKHAVAG